MRFRAGGYREVPFKGRGKLSPAAGASRVLVLALVGNSQLIPGDWGPFGDVGSQRWTRVCCGRGQGWVRNLIESLA